VKLGIVDCCGDVRRFIDVRSIVVEIDGKTMYEFPRGEQSPESDAPQPGDKEA
jgi:hypothetical protein